MALITVCISCVLIMKGQIFSNGYFGVMAIQDTDIHSHGAITNKLLKSIWAAVQI